MKNLLVITAFFANLTAWGYVHKFNNNTENTLHVIAILEGTTDISRIIDPNSTANPLDVGLWPTKKIKIKAIDGPQKGKSREKGILNRSRSYHVYISYDADKKDFVITLL